MKKHLKKLGFLFLSALLIPASSVMAETPQEKGLRIMKGIEKLPRLERVTSEAIFRIYASQGKLVFTKKSRAATFTENYNDPDNRLSRSISYFVIRSCRIFTTAPANSALGN